MLLRSLAHLASPAESLGYALIGQDPLHRWLRFQGQEGRYERAGGVVDCAEGRYRPVGESRDNEWQVAKGRRIFGRGW